MRTLIVHYHIFKNAGSSVDRLLRSSFGDGWASLEGATPTSLLRPDDLSTFVRARPEILAVSSHLLRPPAPTGLRTLAVVLIRHPLDRAYSVYSYLRRINSDLESFAVAQRSDFPQFVDWCLNHKSRGGVVICDYQVIHLSDASFRNGHILEANATEEDLDEAIDYLSGISCLGTVDRFDEVSQRLRTVALEHGLKIAATTAVENVTEGRPQALEQRLALAIEQLGDDLYRRFSTENALDYRLYEWACRQRS